MSAGGSASRSWAYIFRWRSLPLKRRRTTTKNTGTKNTASAVAGDHAAHHAGADGALAGRAGAAGDHQRQHAQDEGQRGHDDRAEAQVAGGQRRFDQALALRLQVFGELDDQHRVLRRQADDGDQADLEVHVVGEAARSWRPAARPARPAAPPGSPPAGWSSFRTAPPGTGTPPGCENASRIEACEPDEFFFARLAGPFEAEAGRQLAASRSISAMASPVLRPGAASPEMRIAG